MSQVLKLKVDVTIPPDSVLVSKVEYEELQEADSFGRVCDLTKFANLLGKTERWASKCILNNPIFKRKIDVKNGGFVYYPETSGQSFSILEDEARKFIKNNFKTIFEQKL